MFSSLLNWLAAASMVPFLALPVEVQIPKCTHPAERREWRTLSRDERAEWIRAVKCVADLPHNEALVATDKPYFLPPINTSSSYYDDLTYIHMDLTDQIHFTGLFFPWHRQHIHLFETALKSECGFTGASPYWDWTQDAADVFGSDLFKDSDPISGLGGWGDPNADFRVQDGAFSHFMRSYPHPHTISRNFTLLPYIHDPYPGFGIIPTQQVNLSFTKTEVEKVINGFEGDFKSFQTYVETPKGLHSSVHEIVGGDMAGRCTGDAPRDCVSSLTFTPNDPLFWLHHAMIDKLWFDWQHKHSANALAFEGGSVPRTSSGIEYKEFPNGGPPWLSLDSILPGDGMFSGISVSDVLETTGEHLCYVYV